MQANQVSQADTWLSVAMRDTLLRCLIALNGTLPSGWLWEYEAAAAVDKVLKPSA